jgi:tetratricopeptide (TPR) repeat protein
MVQGLLGDFTSVIASAEQARDRRPEDPWSHLALGLHYADAGRIADARREAELTAASAGRGITWGKWNLAILWAEVGEPGAARRILKELEETSRTQYISTLWIAQIYAALGEKEQALDWLERNNGEAVEGLWLFYQRPLFDSIRDDPRFRSMLERTNLPTEVNWSRGDKAKR